MTTATKTKSPKSAKNEIAIVEAQTEALFAEPEAMAFGPANESTVLDDNAVQAQMENATADLKETVDLLRSLIALRKEAAIAGVALSPTAYDAAVKQAAKSFDLSAEIYAVAGSEFMAE